MKKLIIAGIAAATIVTGVIAAPMAMAHGGAWCRGTGYCAGEYSESGTPYCYGAGHHRGGGHHGRHNCWNNEYCIYR